MKRLAVFLAVLSLAVLGLESPAQAASAGWISSTCYSHSAMDDPIVFPDQPGASHQHDFVGSTTTDAFSTLDSLRADTCTGTPGDSAAEWVPALTTSTHGTIVPSANGDRDTLTYYRNPSGIRPVTPFPPGFALILGNAHATQPSEEDPGVMFKCGPGGATPGSHGPNPPATCPSGHFLVAIFTFPQFWDGLRNEQPSGIDANDMEHMSYTHDADHPVVLPRLQIYVRYSQATGDVGDVTLASGPYFTAHIDYVNSWDQTAFETLVADCLNADVDCGKDPT